MTIKTTSEETKAFLQEIIPKLDGIKNHHDLLKIRGEINDKITEIVIKNAYSG